MKIIVGISGATGVVYGVRLLERLREAKVETHLVISRWGVRTLLHETTWSREAVEALAHTVYAPGDMGAAISSGSFPYRWNDRRAVQREDAGRHRARHRRHAHSPCRGRRSLKERRRLVLVVRETPLSEIHLENMLKLSRMGAVMLPPVPAFYTHPVTIDDVVDQTVARVLDQFGIETTAPRWDGDMGAPRGAV
jgi:4-hydroxy-3-polyprenylbenzoate decarboxylase